jgi:hypothetical protein
MCDENARKQNNSKRTINYKRELEELINFTIAGIGASHQVKS